MGNGVIAFMFAAGISVWVYSKFQKRTGGYTQRSVISAAVVGLIAFIFFFTVLWTVK